jgi:nicotinamidase-related amidase
LLSPECIKGNIKECQKFEFLSPQGKQKGQTFQNTYFAVFRTNRLPYVDGMSDTNALILIDIQNDYFEGGKSPLAGADATAKVARQVLDKAREKNELVVHIKHVSNRPGATFFLPGTPGIEFHPLLTPQASELVIEKHYPNAFHETALLDELKKRNISRLYFCGMMTHMCVDTTVRAAADYGFKCTVVGGATATKDLTFQDRTVPAEQVQTAFLAALHGLFARVV